MKKLEIYQVDKKKKLVIALSLLSEPKVLLLDECFAALDVLTIKMLQEIIVNLQNPEQRKTSGGGGTPTPGL